MWLRRPTITRKTRQSHKLIHIEIATILDGNEPVKEATVLFLVKAHLHVNTPLCYTRVISTKPPRHMRVTVVFRNAGCCHLTTRIFTESIPGLFFQNEVIVAFEGTGRVEYKCSFPVSLIKQTVMVTWICEFKIEWKNLNVLTPACNFQGSLVGND